MTPSCLIVGAGMAGLTAAAVLQERGWDVVLLDKGRGVGGRMATRRIGGSYFDHGAQFFTVRDSRFREAVARWESGNVVMPWFTEGGHVRYRAVNGMTSLTKHLAKTLNVRLETKVQRVNPEHKGWRVFTEAGESSSARALLLTAPAPQCSSRNVPNSCRLKSSSYRRALISTPVLLCLSPSKVRVASLHLAFCE